jgi:hypothetical protein
LLSSSSIEASAEAWGKDQQKGLFLGIDPAGYRVLNLQSKVAYVARTVKVFKDKFLYREENQIHGLCRQEELCHLNSLETTSAIFEDSRDSPQVPRETKVYCRPHSCRNASTSRASNLVAKGNSQKPEID